MQPESSRLRDEELVANLGWVRRVAFALVADEDLARDVAQDVSRVWLEHARAARSPQRALRAWLAAVTRRIARDRRRSESARLRRERAVAVPESGERAGEDARAVVARGARLERVARAVMELEEPYRSAVLYRYLEELPTAEVARRTSATEATVRKRLERGLALLRARLDRELGPRSDAWAAALLGPWAVAPSGTFSAAWTTGVAIMSAKWIVGAGAAALLAALLWKATPSHEADASLSGGYATITPAVEGFARPASAAIEGAGSVAERTSVGAGRASAVPEQPAAVPALHGAIHVDGEHRLPEGLAIQLSGSSQVAKIDRGAARWSATLDPSPDLRLWAETDPKLWITSPATIPLQVKLDRAVAEHGGTVDLYLVSGRTLELTFLDADTHAPLVHLPFRLVRHVELERTLRQVLTNSDEIALETDHLGQAVVRGIPLAGSLSVHLELMDREREIVMRDGQTLRASWPAVAAWRATLGSSSPALIRETIYTKAPIGEAFARGEVPAWALDALAPGAKVRVVARELATSGTGPGDAYSLPLDASQQFELRAEAPSRHEVWLEEEPSRRRVCAETIVEFAAAGEQVDIRFVRPTEDGVRFHFINVPDAGKIRITVLRPGGAARSEDVACAGREIDHVLRIQAGEQVQVRLRLGQRNDHQAGLQLHVDVDPSNDRDVTVDLAGTGRVVSLEAQGVSLQGEAWIAMFPVESGVVNRRAIVRIALTDGQSVEAERVPAGRWLYVLDEGRFAHAILGTVDVAPAAEGSELVLRPALDLRGRSELGQGIAITEIDGVSLEALGPGFGDIRWKDAGAVVAVPSGARYRVIDDPK